MIGTEERSLVVLRPDGVDLIDRPKGREGEVRLTDTKLPYRPEQLSIIPPHILLLSSDAAGSALHCADGKGVEQWSAPVPFAALQPPIDGANGRVVVAGRGLASFEAGRMIWSVRAHGPVYATAFEDGSLAAASGGELRLLDREGHPRQTFHVEPGEEITTPPAIAGDGAVWVATADAVYVAR